MVAAIFLGTSLLLPPEHWLRPAKSSQRLRCGSVTQFLFRLISTR